MAPENKNMEQLPQLRTRLANERTMLAYIRTGFTAFLSGMALVRLWSTTVLESYLGWIMMLIGFVFLFAGLSYYPRRRLIKRV